MVNEILPSAYTIPLADAVYLARAALPAVSRDDVTPVLTGAFWRFGDGKVTVVSTDRYRVHRAAVDVPEVPAGQALIPKRALQWLSTNSSFFGRVRRIITEPVLTIGIATDPKWEPHADEEKASNQGPRGKVTFTIAQNEAEDADAISLSVDMIAGNFPPVSKMLDEALAAERVVPTGLTDFSRITGVSALGQRGERGHVEFVNIARNGNLSQMVVTFERGAALIQQASS